MLNKLKIPHHILDVLFHFNIFLNKNEVYLTQYYQNTII